MNVRYGHDADRRRTPGPPRWVNRLTLAVLGSPLHRLADADVCELRYRGWRSGRSTGTGRILRPADAAYPHAAHAYQQRHHLAVAPTDRLLLIQLDPAATN